MNILEPDQHPGILALPGLLPDLAIDALCRGGRRMISPYAGSQCRYIDPTGLPCQEDAAGAARIISYGISSAGYDARIAPEYMLVDRGHHGAIDPKRFNPRIISTHKPEPHPVDPAWGEVMIIPPHGFMLARTIETFDMPPDVLAICLGKSTYARCGIVVNVTPLEPGWSGEVTLELSNTTPLPAYIYPNEGVAQFLFFRTGVMPATSYADRAGKYMNQRGITLPRT